MLTLLEHYWWGSVFLVNVPFMILLLIAAPGLVPESRSERARVDVLSSLLSLAAILPIIHALKQIATQGWSPAVLGAVGLGLTSAVAFLWRQGLVPEPMVDLTLFSRRGFGGSVAIQVIGMFGVMGNAVLITQYLQSVLGYSPLSAALWSLAPSVLVGAAAPSAAALARRTGRPPVMAGSFLVASLGFLGMLRAGVGSSVWIVLVGASLVAMGLVAVATLVTEYAIGVAPAERAGSVSALVETASEFGGALGMAVLGSILAAGYAARMADLLPKGMSPDVAGAASETLGEATVVAGQVGGAGGQAILDAARTAYVDAMHVADLVAAAILVIGAVIALTALPRRLGAGVGEPAQRHTAGFGTTDGTERVH